MSRYPDDPDYSSRRRGDAPHTSHSSHSSRRDTREHREPRDHRSDSTRERRTIDDRDTRMNDTMDSRMDTRMDTRMDNRMDSRSDPRANAAARLDPRPDPRLIDGRSTDPEAGVVLVRDPNTGEIYREVRTVGRSPYARDDRYDEAPQRSRTTMDTAMSMDREPTRTIPQYSEHFCPGEGIEREVIQHEICKYLGQDATCRPGRNEQGRAGYWVKAYRPFTTAMEQSLREDTVKWQRERERRARQGRTQGSYADMQARQERERRYPGDMDMDDYDDRGPPRHRDMDPRLIAAAGGRLPIPVTTGYAPDPGYPTSYTISSNQPGYPPMSQAPYYSTDREPRTFAGNSTPPGGSISRSTQGGYVPAPYTTSRTAPPVSASIPANYPDRRGEPMGGAYPPGYSDLASRRHVR